MYGEMFEFELKVGICGPPWKQLLQNFGPFIDLLKRRSYDHFFFVGGGGGGRLNDIAEP